MKIKYTIGKYLKKQSCYNCKYSYDKEYADDVITVCSFTDMWCRYCDGRSCVKWKKEQL